MPFQFSANLSFLFAEHDFPDRFGWLEPCR